MPNAPLANIWFPSEKDRARIIAAVCTSAGAAGAVVGLTIPNNYPPIDDSLPCPIIAIMGMGTGAALVVDENIIWAIAGTMALAPDSVGEFLVTGERTINVWELSNTPKTVLVIYVSKGSGQQT